MNFAGCPGREGGKVRALWCAVYCDVTRAAVPTALFSHSCRLNLFSSTCAQAAKCLLRESVRLIVRAETYPTGAVNTNLPNPSIFFFFISYRAYGHRALEPDGANE